MRKGRFREIFRKTVSSPADIQANLPVSQMGKGKYRGGSDLGSIFQVIRSKAGGHV